MTDVTRHAPAACAQVVATGVAMVASSACSPTAKAPTNGDQPVGAVAVVMLPGVAPEPWAPTSQ